MQIKIKDVTFVRKDKTLFSHPYKTVMEHDQTGYVYLDNAEGVAILPYKIGRNGKEVLIRDEYNPLHTTVLSIITGRKDKGETWRQTAKRELEEEAGIVAEERWFEDLGTILPSGDHKNPDVLCIVDVTGLPQGKPKTDGSIFEKKSTNMWVSVNELHRIVREPSNVDAYLLSAIVKLLEWCGLLVAKSEETDLEKAKKGEEKPGHKYRRREAKASGGYKYIYEEPKEKTGKKEEAKGKKPTMVEQLAALIGKKQGGEEEKAPPKQDDWDAWPIAPADLPEFSKGVTAAQWVSNISRMVDTNVAQYVSSIDDGTFELMNSPTAKKSYIDEALNMMYEKTYKYAGGEDNWKDLNVENKKLDESAKNEVRKAMLYASAALGIVNHTTAVLNSSITAAITGNFESRLKAADANENMEGYPPFEKLSELMGDVKKSLNVADNIIQDHKWLQGTDPKLDWLHDAVYEAVDKLMRTRNRFVKNTFSMFIGMISDKMDSMDDAYSIESTAKLINAFQKFKEDGMYSTTLSKDNKTFANQWNMKQRGIYSGASRFSAHATAKVVNKIKSLDGVESDIAVSRLLTKISDHRAFSFLSFNKKGGNNFHMSEQTFSYINEHGLKKYYEDMMFVAGGRKLFLGDHVAKERGYISAALDVLTKAYEGKDVFKENKAEADKIGKPLGDMTRGNGWAMNFDAGAFNGALNTVVLLNKKSPIEAKKVAFVRMWSSASHNSLMGNAIEALVDSKGIDRGTYVNYHVASNRVVAINRPEVKEVLSTTVTDVYEETQKALGSKTLKLYRGNGANEVKSVASSWTSDRAVADNFGPVITEAEVPAEAVFLYNNSENSDLWSYPYEREHVLIPGILPPERRIVGKVIEGGE